jgi:hypothetical protein
VKVATSSWKCYPLVGLQFLRKSLSILDYLAMNGPSNKSELERRVKPPIDKPTIYKIFTYLEEEEYIEPVHYRKGIVKWQGLARYYRITPSGLEWVFSRTYDVKYRPTSEKTIMTILKKNPHLGYGDEWIGAARALEPLFDSAYRLLLHDHWQGIAKYFTRAFPETPIIWLDRLITAITLRSRNAEDVSARIQHLFALLKAYPTYVEAMRKVINQKLQEKIQDQRRGEIAIAGIRKALTDLET